MPRLCSDLAVALRQMRSCNPLSAAIYGHVIPNASKRSIVPLAVLGQDSACHRRFRSESSDWNLGFPGGALHLAGRPRVGR